MRLFILAKKKGTTKRMKCKEYPRVAKDGKRSLTFLNLVPNQDYKAEKKI